MRLLGLSGDGSIELAHLVRLQADTMQRESVLPWQGRRDVWSAGRCQSNNRRVADSGESQRTTGNKRDWNDRRDGCRKVWAQANEVTWNMHQMVYYGMPAKSARRGQKGWSAIGEM